MESQEVRAALKEMLDPCYKAMLREQRRILDAGGEPGLMPEYTKLCRAHEYARKLFREGLI